MKLLQKIVDIDSETNFKQGDVIITSHHIPCGKCEYCKTAMYQCAVILKRQISDQADLAS